MAFFKFRLPSQRASSIPEASAASPAESLEVVRQRARFRLIGAAVLVLVAVVGFPLVFDTQPRPVPVDTPIVIPDRQATAGLTSAAPAPAQMPAKPLVAASLPSSATATAVASAPPVTAQAALDPKEEIISKPAAAQVPASGASPQTQAPAKAEAKPAQTPAAAKPDAGHKDDSARARALLEGHSKTDAATERHIIQVGAYSDADKLREVRRKLESAGLKTYTQVVDGKDGKRTTRVRIGPFESRSEAEKAAARIRKLDLPANLIKL